MNEQNNYFEMKMHAIDKQCLDTIAYSMKIFERDDIPFGSVRRVNVKIILHDTTDVTYWNLVTIKRIDGNYFAITEHGTTLSLSRHSPYRMYIPQITDAVIAWVRANKELKKTLVTKRFEKASKNAIKLWCTDYEEMRVEINSEHIKFYYRVDGECSTYHYAPLSQLKHDDDLRIALCSYWLEDEKYESTNGLAMAECFEIWKNSTNELPPFDIADIWACEYCKYTYDEIE